MFKQKGFHFHETLSCIKWEHTGSNRGPSACKADALNQLSYAPKYFISRRPLPIVNRDALNQLSYAPFLFWDGKDKGKMFSAKFFTVFLKLIMTHFKIFGLFLPYKYVNLLKYQISGRHRYPNSN